jgi:pyruvate dehydrogenase E2 component (dihydrolipoamide acetyltransferase)
MTLSMEEGYIGEWYVKEGDEVKADDPLCSVENEKETEDLTSVQEGTILKLIAEEGGTYPVNSPIAIIGSPGEDISALLAKAAEPAAEPAAEEKAESILPAPVVANREPQVSMMPKVRMLIRQKGIDLDELISFCDGRKITEAEVEAFEQSKKGEN